MRDSPMRRRLITVPAVVVGFCVLLPLLFVLVPVAAVVDVLLGRSFATVRLLAFATCYLAWEVVSVVASFALWVASGFGLFMRRRWVQRATSPVAGPLGGLAAELGGIDPRSTDRTGRCGRAP